MNENSNIEEMSPEPVLKSWFWDYQPVALVIVLIASGSIIMINLGNWYKEMGISLDPLNVRLKWFAYHWWLLTPFPVVLGVLTYKLRKRQNVKALKSIRIFIILGCIGIFALIPLSMYLIWACVTWHLE
ncbi:hypothetical protein ACFL54_05480 [Planctomycetota bacterium]